MPKGKRNPNCGVLVPPSGILLHSAHKPNMDTSLQSIELGFYFICHRPLPQRTEKEPRTWVPFSIGKGLKHMALEAVPPCAAFSSPWVLYIRWKSWMLWEPPNICTVSKYRLQTFSPQPLQTAWPVTLQMCTEELANTHRQDTLLPPWNPNMLKATSTFFFSAEILRDPHYIMQWIKSEDSPVTFLPYPHLAGNLQPWPGILFSKLTATSGPWDRKLLLRKTWT